MTEVNKEELRRLANEATETEMDWPSAPTLCKWIVEEWAELIAAADPHVVLSLLDENEALIKQVAALQSDENSWQSGYDKGREMGAKHRAADVDQLRAEVESLRAQLKACHPFRPAHEPVTVFAPGCLVCGQYTDHGGLQCPKMRAACTAQEGSAND